MKSREEMDVSLALKSIARNPSIKSHLQQSPELYSLLWHAARRFVTGETRQNGIATAQSLIEHGYSVSVEFIGENTSTEQDCRAATDEFLALSQAMATASLAKGSTISLNLSHIGLMLSPQLALSNLRLVAEEAAQHGFSIMISMEESGKVANILDVYTTVAQQYPNVGITLQAYLHRTNRDIDSLMHLPGKVRLVKGAYQESPQLALTRSATLDRHYLSLLDQLVEAEQAVSIATHDEGIIQEVLRRNYLSHPHVEVEMLYGIHPDLPKRLRDAGFKTRIYLTYGTEWYLYLCHRLAEYPPNIYRALTDCIEPSRTEQPYKYYY